MKRNSYLTLLLTIVFVSCGKKSVETNQAPRTIDEIGIIASCTSRAQALEIATASGTQFRVLSEKRKLIEFIGLSREELSKLLPKARLKDNKIFENIVAFSNVSTQSVPNTEYYGPHTPVYRNSGSGRSFPHLEQI